MRSKSRRVGRGPGAAALALAACAALAVHPAAAGGDEASADSSGAARPGAGAELEAAIAYYARDLNFDRAIGALGRLLDGGELAPPDRVRALEVLALAHIGKGQSHLGEARKAIEQMVEIAPGHQPDPDRLHPEFMKLYFTVAKERGLLAERESPGILTIAVLDFDNNSIDQHDRLEPLRGGFADMLISDLSKLTTLKVVERERVRFILDELDLEQTAKFDPETAARVGKMLGAHSILIGSFTKVGERMRLDTRLIRTETGELVKADQITRKTDDFFKLIDDAAELVAKDLELKVSDAERGAIQKADNESMDALIYYSEGLELYDRGEYRKAYEKFREALRVNPDYERAEMRLAAIKPLVG